LNSGMIESQVANANGDAASTDSHGGNSGK
jgi:hypothetical protein